MIGDGCAAVTRRTVLSTAGRVAAATSASIAGMSISDATASGAPGPDTARLVDVHAHHLPDFYVAEARRAGIEFPDGMPFWPQWSPGEHLRLMDTNGVEKSILSISSPGVHFGDDAAARSLARRVNDFGAEVVTDHPGRFGLFASLPLPDVPGAIAEGRRALDDLHADGVAVLSNSRGMYLGDVRMEPLLAFLDSRRARVFVHPAAPPNAASASLGLPIPMIEFLFDSARAVTNLVLLDVVERHPGIRWIFCHGGGVVPLIADRVDFFRRQFHADGLGRPMRAVLADLWFDTAGTPFPRVIPTLTSMVGTKQIVYGSDHCFTPAAAVAEQVRSIETAPPPSGVAGWRTLLRGNADRLLRAPR